MMVFFPLVGRIGSLGRIRALMLPKDTAPGRTTFSVVVPTLNASETIQVCLDSVEEALKKVGGGEIIVVDNGSADGTVDLVRSRASAVSHILEVRGTISESRNLGAEKATGEILSFVDSDCVLDPEYFLAGQRRLMETEWSAVGSPYALPDNPVWVERVWDGLTVDYSDGPTHFLPGGNFLVRAEAFSKVEGFDEALITGEDWNIGKRLGEAGFKLYRDHSVSVAHLGNPKTVAGFFRKQRWHSASLLKQGLSKTLVATLAYGVLTVGAVLLLMLRFPGGLVSAMGLVAMSQVAIPALFLLHRFATGGKVESPIRSAFLYWAFLLARSITVVGYVFGHRARRG